MISLIAVYDPHRELAEDAFDKMILTAGLTKSNVVYQSEWCGLAVKNFYDLPATNTKNDDLLAWIGEFEQVGTDLACQQLRSTQPNAILTVKGAFLAARINEAEKNLTLISDRFGSYPCYLHRYKSAVVFSTAIQPMLTVIRQPSLNLDAVATLLSIGEVINDQTLLSGITTLPAAARFSCSADAIKSEQYWHYVHEEDFSGKRCDRVAETGEALRTAVNNAIEAYHHVSIPLSGGLDSRFLHGLATKTDRQVDAFTWGVPGCKDLRYAKAVCEKTQTPHHQFEFAPDYLAKLAKQGVAMTEGVTPAVHFHVLPFADKMNLSGRSVLLDGFAGDATLGGNFINSAWLDNDDFHQAANSIWRWRLNGFCQSAETLGLNDYQQHAKEQFTALYQRYAGASSMDKAMAFLLDNRVRRITTAGTQIFRSQIMVKQPFMHQDMIEVTRKLPHEWRKRHRFYLEVMKQSTPDVAKVPWQRTSLPVSVPYWMTLASLGAQRYLGKQWPFSQWFSGKSPSQFDEWFRGPLRSFVESTLFSDKSQQRGVLPIEVLKNAWQLHQARKLDATNLIGAALTIELFAQQFIDINANNSTTLL